MISKDTLIIKNKDWFQYVSQNGGFFVYSPENQQSKMLVSCREEFQAYYFRPKKDSSPYVGFYSSYLDINAFDRFWTELEDKVNVEPKSQIYRTNIASVVILKLSPFWIANSTRKSILTLFIRGFGAYGKNRKSLVGAMVAYPLAAKVINAVNWFLAGNTQPTYSRMNSPPGGYGGFIYHFAYRSNDRIKKMLVKPKT